MTVSVNGEPRPVTAAQTVAELIAELALPPRAILVEHNGVALHRHEWRQRPLAEGDTIEVLRVVAGG